ncbi:MAG: thiamine phosphate synthase [Muribaculaceae bacterium]|nr:thiamine phosphate synthase [Muribaculaceae bacterium]
MLQYITNTQCDRPVTEQIKAVLNGGCKWIQIRMKDASDEEIQKVVEEVKPIAAEKGAFLVLDDRVELCEKLELTGVHLGKNDMLPAQARVKLGPLAIIGVTANTFDDVIAVRSLDVDYIGIGPFRHTLTKENLSPILGIDGIKTICKEMESNGIEIPRVAVGGIKTEDVKSLLDAGCNGIAVSGAIAFADDMEAETRKFISLLPIF